MTVIVAIEEPSYKNLLMTLIYELYKVGIKFVVGRS